MIDPEYIHTRKTELSAVNQNGTTECSYLYDVDGPTQKGSRHISSLLRTIMSSSTKTQSPPPPVPIEWTDLEGPHSTTLEELANNLEEVDTALSHVTLDMFPDASPQDCAAIMELARECARYLRLESSSKKSRGGNKWAATVEEDHEEDLDLKEEPVEDDDSDHRAQANCKRVRIVHEDEDDGDDGDVHEDPPPPYKRRRSNAFKLPIDGSVQCDDGDRDDDEFEQRSDGDRDGNVDGDRDMDRPEQRDGNGEVGTFGVKPRAYNAHIFNFSASQALLQASPR